MSLQNNQAHVVLKGEQVRDIFLSVTNADDRSYKKAVDCLVFNGLTSSTILLVELSKTIHKLSDIICKFEESLEHLKHIMRCEDENMRNTKLAFVLVFEKIRNKSELKVVFGKNHIEIDGQRPMFVKLKCGESINGKLQSRNIAVLNFPAHNTRCVRGLTSYKSL